MSALCDDCAARMALADEWMVALLKEARRIRDGLPIRTTAHYLVDWSVNRLYTLRIVFAVVDLPLRSAEQLARLVQDEFNDLLASADDARIANNAGVAG